MTDKDDKLDKVMKAVLNAKRRKQEDSKLGRDTRGEAIGQSFHVTSTCTPGHAR